MSGFSLMGRLIPGLRRNARIKLIHSEFSSREGFTGLIASDGRYYFEGGIPPGEYLILAQVQAQAESNKWSDLYYPGAIKRTEALRFGCLASPPIGHSISTRL